MKSFLSSVLVALCALSMSSPSTAQITYTNLYVAQGYTQTIAGSSYIGSYLSLGLATVASKSFTSASVLTPGANSPIALNWNPTLLSNGAYGGNYIDASFPSLDGVVSTNLGLLSAAFPLGAYKFTAQNSVTTAQQSATLNYNTNYWPTILAGGQNAVPALTATSFAALQGLNATSKVTLDFNSFTGSAVRCCGETPLTNPYVELSIHNTSTGATVYNSGRLSDSIGSIVLPSNTLQANTNYSYLLTFDVGRHCGSGQGCDSTNPVGSYMDWGADTSGQFSTIQTAPPNTTVVNLQGGTLANPVQLQSQGRIGQLNGSIGGAGAQDFYVFYWGGGLFQANAQLYGAPPLDKYQFELLDQHGAVLETFALDQADNFTANLSHNLIKGANYEIGLIANNSNIDPSYSINFLTPVESVDEPGMATLTCLGLFFVGLKQWNRSKRNRVAESATGKTKEFTR